MTPPGPEDHAAAVTGMVVPWFVNDVVKVTGLPLLVAPPFATVLVISGVPELLRKR